MSADEGISDSLISAVREGRLQIVEELISSHGLSYSAAWADGYMLLCNAVEYEHTEISKLLLTNGCKVNSITGEPANTPLHFAARNGDIEIVEMLLDRGANTNDKNQFGNTPLHYAIEGKNMGIAALLISRGADVNAKGRCGVTSLHIAANRGYFQIVEHLLKHGANVNSEYISTSIYREGYTPLCLAVTSNSERIVELLLCRGADVNAKGIHGVTSLHIGAEKGYLQIVNHLLKHGADVNAAYTSTERESYTPLCLAAKRGHIDIVELLLQHGANVDAEGKDGKTVLQCAVEGGHPVIVQHVLKHCPNVNNTNNRNIIYNAVVLGCGNGYNEIIVNLLQYGFTLNPEHVNISDLLHGAVRNRHLKIVEEYLKYNTDINMLHSLLYVAIENKNEDICKLLIRNGASVNAQKNKTPPLCAAVKYKLKEIVEVLLDHGADVQASDGYGRTALYFTALPSILAFHSLKGCGEIAKVLLSRGANVNAQCCKGLTTLHMAVERENKNVVEILLEHNANVNTKDGSYRTPLHVAAKGYNGLITAMLLKHGADINIMNNFNETPLDLAMDDRVREILMHHVIMRKAANLYLTEENLLSIVDNKSFQNECEKELAAMRSEKIGNSIISFYDILTKDISRLAIILQNENIVQILRLDDYKIKFPLYGSMIKNQFRKGQTRNESLNQVNKYCGIIFTQLPYCCTQTIISYLSDTDLQILASACEPANVDEVTPSRPKKRHTK